MRSYLRSLSLSAVLLLASGRVSYAQSATCAQQAQADALEVEGRTLRDAQRDAEAVERFRRSYELCRGARALARLALAEGGLGLWVEAERDLSTALQQRDRWVEQNAAVLRRNLDDVIRARLGSLELIGEGPPGEIFINGRAAGTWPRSGSFAVVAGTVTVEVRSPQHELFRRSVEVPARTLVREQVRLVPRASAVTTQSAAVSPSGTAPSTVVPPLRYTSRETSWQVPVGWTAVGLAAAGVGVGVAGLLHAQARRSTYDNDARCTPRETDASYCASIIDGVDAGRAMTIAGFVSGGVLAVLGTVLLVTAPSRSGGSGRAWACAPAVGGGAGGGLTCAVRF